MHSTGCCRIAPRAFRQSVPDSQNPDQHRLFTASIAVKEASQVWPAHYTPASRKFARDLTRQIGCTGSASVTARENESKEVALERMIQESARVEEQVIQIFNHQEFQQQLEEVDLHAVVVCNSVPSAYITDAMLCMALL